MNMAWLNEVTRTANLPASIKAALAIAQCAEIIQLNITEMSASAGRMDKDRTASRICVVRLQPSWNRRKCHLKTGSTPILKRLRWWLQFTVASAHLFISAELRGRPNRDTQANGALMRISPLVIFCWNHTPESTSRLAQQDAALTHSPPVCLQANALFAMTIADAISQMKSPQETYEGIKNRAAEMKVENSLTRSDFGPFSHRQKRSFVQDGKMNQFSGCDLLNDLI
jgi:hypothetical protein